MGRTLAMYLLQQVQNKTSLKQVGSASYKDIASVEKHRSACHTECGSKPSAAVIPVAISEKRDWGKSISNIFVNNSFLKNNLYDNFEK